MYYNIFIIYRGEEIKYNHEIIVYIIIKNRRSIPVK